ncbi:uncharacterized protein B0I36DRAFT_83160 [Microdochium trichocladiopsis]|uniref:Uncharacterized protein n=1 Tax=Microdochium trichocladiopsis TaxID=1682393 RepID=A0A9P8YB29_9PEZI|nr:uncharacterized protein B0I36DRAFT_83160 [Microdochium trichocladiopsis]KAH7034690.1 hypothetical protein B0I36DRAFT_83160 [Microdochium trichocladiopsis]
MAVCCWPGCWRWHLGVLFWSPNPENGISRAVSTTFIHDLLWMGRGLTACKGSRPHQAHPCLCGRCSPCSSHRYFRCVMKRVPVVMAGLHTGLDASHLLIVCATPDMGGGGRSGPPAPSYKAVLQRRDGPPGRWCNCPSPLCSALTPPHLLFPSRFRSLCLHL